MVKTCREGACTMRADLQVVLPLERFPTHGTDVFPLVAVGELVFGQGGGVAKHFGTYLQRERGRCYSRGGVCLEWGGRSRSARRASETEHHRT